MILVLAQLALANADGKTGSTDNGCTCHGDPSNDTVVTMTADASTVDPGAVVNITLLVQNGALSEAGMNAAADEGTLGAGAASQESRGEITHDGPAVLATGEASFQFTWTAPDAGGTYAIHGAGNATNANGEKTGDAWAFADDLEIVVNTLDGDADTDADAGTATDTDTDTASDTADDSGQADDAGGCGCNGASPAATFLPALGALLAARRRR